jgi:hypothetical protein
MGEETDTKYPTEQALQVTPSYPASHLLQESLLLH